MKASTLLWATFPPTTIRLLKELSRFVSARGGRAFIVGGAVRDAILGVPTADIDIMLEGEFFALAREIKEGWSEVLPGTALPHRLITFPKYHTAKILFPLDVVPGIATIDFSGARREEYLRPGAQPIVSPGTLEDDLRRRDFSVNAMALALDSQRFGEILDLFGSQEHLRTKTLSVLHPASFSDDPVRLVRGARFLTRFDFNWSPETSRLAQQAAVGNFLETVKVERRFEELKKALSERRLLRTLSLLEKFNLLPHLAPGAVIDARTKRALTELEGLTRGGGGIEFSGRRIEPWKLALVALFLGVSEANFIDALARMTVSSKQLPELMQLRAELEGFYAP